MSSSQWQERYRKVPASPPTTSSGARRRPFANGSDMARIIGGIGTSHVPTIGLAFDRGKQDDPDWAPLFDGYAPVAKWLAERQPDVLVYFYNDHATTFLFDLYPTFALGVGEQFAIADEGLGPRQCRRSAATPALARHLARSLVYDEFDLAVFQDLRARPRLQLAALDALAVRSRTGRSPSCRSRSTCSSTRCRRRCAATSSARRCAARSSPIPRISKVVVVGTGGLSHQMSGPRAGFNNTEWDLRVPRSRSSAIRRRLPRSRTPTTRGSAAPRARR